MRDIVLTPAATDGDALAAQVALRAWDGILGPDRPAWVDQLLSEESLAKSGYFDPAKIARQRKLQTSMPPVTLRRFVMDQTLTCVVTTQLWHHIYCGGGLCDLPVWQPPRWEKMPHFSRAVASGV